MEQTKNPYESWSIQNWELWIFEDYIHFKLWDLPRLMELTKKSRIMKWYIIFKYNN